MHAGLRTGSAQPASSAHPGFPEGAPLPRAPGQLGTVSPSPALEETRSSFRLVAWQPGQTQLLQAPPQHLSLIGLSSLVLETRNFTNVVPMSEGRREEEKSG